MALSNWSDTGQIAKLVDKEFAVKKSVPPSITATAFECPHCGAFAAQQWHELHAIPITMDPRVPTIIDKGWVAQFHAENPEPANSWLIHIEALWAGLVSLEPRTRIAQSSATGNLHLSECYNCKKFAVWVHKSLVSPGSRSGPIPNEDLPDEITRDFEEARAIIELSPRGAAALLRLAVQKLCVFLGEKGKSIDADIASLVTKGLLPLTQKALDVVRVVGNEAVHPGTLDLKDDRDTVLKLFGLVNTIAEQMITTPKSLQELYDGLPLAKLEGIRKRDEKTPSGNGD